MSRSKGLFSPGKIGSLYLKNRIIMAPLGSRLTSENGGVTEDMIEFYSRRARGGAGIITIEAMGIDYPLSVGKPNHVRFHDEKYMPGHAKLTEKIHENGGKVFALLWHAGINRGMFEGMRPVGPSDILNPNTGIIPRKLTVEEIRELVEKFGIAAQRAMQCGYDGIMIHAAHGYLISSFVSSATNKRDDQYGGSFENRIRFGLEVARKVRETTSKDYPIVFRINGSDFIDGGIDINEAIRFAVELEKVGVDAIDVSAGVYESIDTMIEPIQYDEGWKIYLAEHIRKHLSIPVSGVGVIRSPEIAERMINEGKVDFVAIGRELLCEPDWAKKAMEGDLHFLKCICCNACFSRICLNLPIRCAINPLAGRELHIPDKVKEAKKIAIVGAGPAGISAALTASKRGHRVELFEKTDRIGGQMILAAIPPLKTKISDYIHFLEGEIKNSDITLHLNREFRAEDSKDFDSVIVATGAKCRDLEIPNSQEIRITAWEALFMDEAAFKDKDIIVIGAGSVGCETALYIKGKGARSVYLIEIREQVAVDMDNITRLKIKKELNEQDVQIYTSFQAERVEDNQLIIQSIKGNRQEMISCDRIVVAVGASSLRNLAEDLYNSEISENVIGDAFQVAQIGEAVRSGFNSVATI